MAVVDGRVVGVMCLEVTADGIAAFRNQVNPDKLDRATAHWAAADHGEPLFTRSERELLHSAPCQETAGRPVQGANPRTTGASDMQHRIIVLGAGYAGAIAAGRLAKRLHRDDVAITLVNAEPDFVERVRMHQLATGQDLKPRPFSEMFAGTGVELRLARVTGVDVDRKTVAVDGRRRSSPTTRSSTPSAAAGTPRASPGPPSTPTRSPAAPARCGCASAWPRLDAGQRAWSSSAAASPAWRPRPRSPRPARTSTSPSPPAAASATGSPRKGREHLRKVFDKLGITVYEHAAVTGVDADRVTTADGTAIPAAVTVWTAGFAVHPIAEATALEVTDTGQIVVDGTMRSVSHPDVYAVGDAALAMGPGDKPLRMSCASGTPMAWQAADAIAARLTGGKLPHAPLRYFNQCISLGRRKGLIQYVTADDRARSVRLTGRLAAATRS